MEAQVEIRGPGGGESERDVLAQLGGGSGLVMGGKKVFQILEDGRIRRRQRLTHLGPYRMIVGRSQLGIVAGGVDRGQHREQTWTSVELTALGRARHARDQQPQHGRYEESPQEFLPWTLQSSVVCSLLLWQAFHFSMTKILMVA